MLVKVAIGLAVGYVGTTVAIAALEESSKVTPRYVPRPLNWQVTEPDAGPAEV